MSTKEEQNNMSPGITKEKINFFVLFFTMMLVCLIVAGATMGILYQTAFKEERLRLKENAESQSYLMEAMARFDASFSAHDHPGGAVGATISQIRDAHEHYNSFAKSGEFLIGKLEKDKITFLFGHLKNHVVKPSTVPLASTIAEPMRRALLGESGTMIGLDYRNVKVLAAYHPVPALKLGIVVKIDLQEIREPFIRAGILVFATAMIAITLGALFFYRISNPIIAQLQNQGNSLREYADQINNTNIELKISNNELNREISRRKQVTQTLQQNEKHIRLLLNSTSEGIYGLDTHGNCTFVNAAALRLLGYKEEKDLLNKNMHYTIHHTNDDGTPLPETECTIFRAFQSGEECHADKDMLWRADGTNFAAEYWSYPIKEDDITIGAVVTFFDITERNRAKQKLEASLNEKETLLKEVHHRVKNNMQIISSLLSLQSRQATNAPETKQVIEECRGRVKTMALIHEKLYQSHNLGSIDFADYLHDLTADLNRTRQNNDANIAITVRSDQIFLPVDAAIPCGLIINELVTNAFKHGFPDNASGEINIHLHKTDEDTLRLTVKDNGQGFIPDIEINQTNKLGLTLVANLARQLDATLEYQNNDGFECTFAFKIEEPEKPNERRPAE
ncbi:MAG: PAS domain S-box protein [Desulfobulbaceae bacterium]|nr:PAS domain S-box protein [Desulfobulbaceae bacterium]